MTFFSNWNQNQISSFHTLLKWIILIWLHVCGALLLTYIVVMILIYLGFIGEISSQTIFCIWQKLGIYFLPTAIVFLSLLVITLTNPVYSLVCLILIFFSAALFLLSINVNFLAMIYLIIYIGAIAILFLFVIMMFNLRELKRQSTEINDYSFLSISFIFYSLLLWKFYALLLDHTISYVEYDKYFNHFVKEIAHNLQYFLTYQHVDTLLFGTLLYEYYSYLFILAALILLTSMLGSIILALSTTEKTTDIPSLASITPLQYASTKCL